MNSLPSGLHASVDDSETLARFCTLSSWFARQNLRVKYPAFLPAPDDDTFTAGPSVEPSMEHDAITSAHTKKSAPHPF